MFVGFGKVTSLTMDKANGTIWYCFKVYKALKVSASYWKYAQQTQNLTAQKIMQLKYRFAFNELVSVGKSYAWHLNL